MGKRLPRTGEPRQEQRLLSIDLLPMDVLQAIKRLRMQHGLTYREIERLSSLPYKEDWEKRIGTAGFVNWDAISTKVLQKFPNLRIPQINIHRWLDLRYMQSNKLVRERAQFSQELAESFANASIAKPDQAVLNAARDVLFETLQAVDEKHRHKAAAGLIALAEVMNGAKANEIKARKVATEEKKLKILLRDAEMKQRRFAKEMDDAAKKVSRGQAITKADIDRIRERVFGIGPAAA